MIRDDLVLFKCYNILLDKAVNILFNNFFKSSNDEISYIILVFHSFYPVKSEEIAIANRNKSLIFQSRGIPIEHPSFESRNNIQIFIERGRNRSTLNDS